MEIRKILGVLFDLDGTLVRIPINYTELREKLKKIALKYGVHSDFKPIIGEIDRLAKILKNKEEFIEECIKIVDYYEEKAVESVELITGAKECLSLLKSMGKKIGVVSNNSNSCVIKVLKNTDLLKYIDVLVGREKLKVKPDPYPILLAIDKLNIKNENVIMIGDSEIDLEAAKKAGITGYIFKGSNLYDFIYSIEDLSNGLR